MGVGDDPNMGKILSDINDLQEDAKVTLAVATEALDGVKWLKLHLGEDRALRGPVFARLQRVEEQSQANTDLRLRLTVTITVMSGGIGVLAWAMATAPGLLKTMLSAP
jgi:hypothetical protein